MRIRRLSIQKYSNVNAESDNEKMYAFVILMASACVLSIGPAFVSFCDPGCRLCVIRGMINSKNSAAMQLTIAYTPEMRARREGSGMDERKAKYAPYRRSNTRTENSRISQLKNLPQLNFAQSAPVRYASAQKSSPMPADAAAIMSFSSRSFFRYATEYHRVIKNARNPTHDIGT